MLNKKKKAQEKVFSELGRWKKIKDSKPDTLIAVGGCVASQEGKNIKQRASCVDIVLDHKHFIDYLK